MQKREIRFFTGVVKRVYDAGGGNLYAQVSVPPWSPRRGTADLPLDEIGGGPPTVGDEVTYYCICEEDETGGSVVGRRLEVERSETEA